jgi:hypothetical protein
MIHQPVLPDTVGSTSVPRCWKNYTTDLGIPVFAVLNFTKPGFLKDPGYRSLTKYHTAPSRLTGAVLKTQIHIIQRRFHTCNFSCVVVHMKNVYLCLCKDLF